MKALIVHQYGPADQHGIAQTAIPEPAPGEVRVRVRAVGLGFVDGLKMRGLYQTKDPLPFVPGTEFAGDVDAAPGGRFKPGDRVFGTVRNGALAEYVVASADELQALHADISFAQAAGVMVNYSTALYALREIAKLQHGESLLVLGAAGGTGTAAIHVGKLLGANIIAAASSEPKRAFAITMGADQVIDYTESNWRDRLKEMTGGNGVNVIFDGVGGEMSPLAFRSLAWRGRHLVVGFAAGSIPALPFNIALLKGAALMGVDLAQVRRREPEINDSIKTTLSDWLARGLLKPGLEIYPFADFVAAFGSMAQRKAIGKVVVTIE